ncbi:MAG TPA: DNA-directed RNA polymerase subunit delta [Bacillota bacterium]|nr:DNA-directed RNA polymerase subunit delta [Bacillota bacterium]
MSLENYSYEEIKKISMIDLAMMIMEENKEAMHFKDVFERLAELKRYSEEQKNEYLDQFYTDLNFDGRFLTIGSNMWGLKRWYPVEQIDEVVSNETRKKKKKKAAPEMEETTFSENDLDSIDDEIDQLTDDDDYADYSLGYGDDLEDDE